MTTELVCIVLIMSLAGFIRSAFSFGDALFAMPLLALVLPVTAAAPLMALVALLIAIVILAREWTALDFRSAAALIISGMIGIPIGVFLLALIDPRIVKCGLGMTVVLFSVWSLWKPDLFLLKTDLTAPVFGVLAGLLGGAYNTSGPPLVIYSALRRWPVARFRATLQVYCLFSSTCILLSHGVAGHLDRDTLFRFGVSVPLVVLATMLGQKLTSRLATDRFVRMVHVLLIILVIFLVGSSITDRPESEVEPAQLREKAVG